MKKVLGTFIGSMALMPILTHADSPYFSLQEGDSFKRFSVSVGALHVMPQGKAHLLSNTIVAEGETSKVGDVATADIIAIEKVIK
nr:hypothetical protein [Acinetobacter sp. LoGeW2-3]